MRKLPLSAKLGFIGTLALLPLVWLTTMWVRDQNVQIDFAQSELIGAKALSALLDVAVATQTHRGQTNMLLSGNTAAGTALKTTREQLSSAIDRTDVALAETDWSLVKDWQRVREPLAGLTQGRHPPERTAAFAAHTAHVAQLTKLAKLLGEQSQLLYDPIADTYLMAELTVMRLMPWSEVLGLLRGQGAGVLSAGTVEPTDRVTLLSRVGLLETRLDELHEQGEALVRAGKADALQRIQTAMAPSRDFAALVRQRFGGDAPVAASDAAAYFQQGTRAIEAVVHFQREASAGLTQSLQARQDALSLRRTVSLGGAALCLLALAWAGYCYYRSTVQVVRRVERAARAVAAGDLTSHVRIDGSDELAMMAAEIEAMRERLLNLVRSIRSQAQQVASSGDVLSDDSIRLAAQTQQQAGSVEESAATLAQVAQSVRSNGEQVRAAGRLFVDVRQTVDAGSERMQRAVQSVQSIEATSQRVGDIISVIDGIAFQTNILALNAAVEAARAGEAGKGFAVVASEVRSLAQRCGNAASEIRSLLAESTQRVADGAGHIREVSTSLDDVMSQVRSFDHAMQALSRASEEQTTAVEQVAEAVRLIGQTTEQNASTVQSTSLLASQMEEQARSLLTMVSELRTEPTAA